MSDRDPVENALDSLAGAIVVGGIGLIIAILAGSARKNRKPNEFVHPETLEVAYDHPEYKRFEEKMSKPSRENQTNCLLTLVAIATWLGLVIAFFVLVSNGGVFDFIFWLLLLIGAALILRKLGAGMKQQPVIPADAEIRAPLDFEAIQVYTIALPQDTQWNTERAARFMQQILQKLNQATFQIVVERGHMHWQIIDHRAGVQPAVVRQAVQAFYPDAKVSVDDLPEAEVSEPFHRYTLFFEQTDALFKPISYPADIAKADPLVNLTQEINTLGKGERVTYTLIAADPALYIYHQALRVLTIEAGNPLNINEMAYNMAAEVDNRELLYEGQEEQIIYTKFQNQIYQALLLIQVDAPTRERAVELAQVASHIHQFRKLDNNSLVLFDEPVEARGQVIQDPEQAEDTDPLGLLDSWLTNRNTKWQNFRLALDTQEMAALWHLPHEGFTASSIDWVEIEKAPIPDAMLNEEGSLFLGYGSSDGQTRPVYMLEQDRAMHTLITGQIGAGKSTLALNLIHQDIDQGRALPSSTPNMIWCKTSCDAASKRGAKMMWWSGI